MFAEQRAQNRAQATEALDQLKRLGVTVYSLAPTEAERWLTATRSLFDEFGAKSPETKAMVEKILALRT